MVRAAVSAALCSTLAATQVPTAARPPTRSDLAAAEARLMELESDVGLVVERYNQTHERLELIRAEIGATRRRADAIERRMVARQRVAVRIATELYKAGPAAALEPLLSADSIGQMDQRLTYLDSSQAAQRRVFEGLLADHNELEAVLAELEEQQERVAVAATQLDDLRATIEAKVAAQRDEIAELTAAIERAQARRAARRETRADAARREARADAARRAARDTRRQARVAAVERPAPADRDAAGTGGDNPVAGPVDPPPEPTGAAGAAVQAALSQVGKPYRWGAAGPDEYDCSGLTMWAWARAGVSLPHSSQMQYGATARLSQGSWRPGDLLFFGSPIHHVAMYVGNGRMVEAPFTGASVRVVSAYRGDYAGAGRPGV